MDARSKKIRQIYYHKSCLDWKLMGFIFGYRGTLGLPPPRARSSYRAQLQFNSFTYVRPLNVHVLRNGLINLIALISNPGREVHAGISIIIILIQYDVRLDGRDLDAGFNYVVRQLLRQILKDLEFVVQVSVVVNLCMLDDYGGGKQPGQIEKCPRDVVFAINGPWVTRGSVHFSEE